MVENGGEEEDFFPLFLNNKSLFQSKISREAIYLFIQLSFIVTFIEQCLPSTLLVTENTKMNTIVLFP